MIENDQVLTPEHVTKLQEACITLSCKKIMLIMINF